MLKVFEAFAGIGSQTQALKNIGVEHEVVAISEIDKYAIASYESIHGKVKNLGDISKLKDEDIPKHDLFTYSFPCQDISLAGKQQGLDKDSNTRSSLLWECERVIAVTRPKYLLLENVKNLVGKKHKHNFDEWLEVLEGYGYKNYWQVLNAKDFGIPQNRERVFVVSIRNDIDCDFEFPKPIALEKHLKDMLEDDVDEKFYLTDEQKKKFVYHENEAEKNDQILSVGDLGLSYRSISRVLDPEGICSTLDTMQGGNRQPKILEKKEIKIKANNKKGYTIHTDGASISLEHPNSKGKHTRATNDISRTLTTCPDKGVLEINEQNYRIRKLTPKECWRLMGFKDEQFYKAQEVCSNSQLYKQAGNSIVVNVLEAIFSKIFLG